MKQSMMWLVLAIITSSCPILSIRGTLCLRDSSLPTFVFLIGNSLKYSSGCFVERCNNSVSTNGSCASALICYQFQTSTNATVCAPPVVCSLFDSCISGTRCATNASVCIVNSCCSVPICMPLALASVCVQQTNTDSGRLLWTEKFLLIKGYLEFCLNREES
jgi:hypothetical protein